GGWGGGHGVNCGGLHTRVGLPLGGRAEARPARLAERQVRRRRWFERLVERQRRRDRPRPVRRRRNRDRRRIRRQTDQALSYGLRRHHGKLVSDGGDARGKRGGPCLIGRGLVP